MYIVKSTYNLRIKNHDEGWQLHTHESMIEIELMTEGSGYHFLNGHYYPIKKGWFWISRPQDFHEVTVPKGVNIISIQIKPAFISKELLALLIDYQSDICAELSDSLFQKILTICETIFEEYESNDLFSLELIQRQIELMLLQVFRYFKIAPTKRKETDKNAFIEKAILYLKTNFSENPSLDTTAAYIHFNSDYFATLFKKHIGKTYYRYLTELKLEQAKKLILETDMSLSVICFKCGFGNQSNFLRQFKRSYGCTPTQMRQRKFN